MIRYNKLGFVFFDYIGNGLYKSGNYFAPFFWRGGGDSSLTIDWIILPQK